MCEEHLKKKKMQYNDYIFKIYSHVNSFNKFIAKLCPYIFFLISSMFAKFPECQKLIVISSIKCLNFKFL